MKVTKRKLQAILKESVFTPSEPGPLKIIAEVGDKNYYVQRSIELCKMFLEDPGLDYLTQAISLLALAKYYSISDKK